MKNIVLIGMPGAGKSTIGVLLAKTMLMDFVDTDLIIQNRYSSSLCSLIEKSGCEEFLKMENDIISKNDFNNSVVATGGSAVYGAQAMKKLKSSGVLVYLSLPVEEIENRIRDIKTRGVVMRNGETIQDLYSEREPLYQKYADVTIECTGLTPEKCVERIIEATSCLV